MLSIQYRYNFVWIKYSQSYGKIASDTTQYFLHNQIPGGDCVVIAFIPSPIGDQSVETLVLEVPGTPNGASTHIFHMSYSNWN